MRLNRAQGAAAQSSLVLGRWALLGACWLWGALPLMAPGRDMARSGLADWLEAFHFNYTISGLGVNKPSQVFDDGVSTWIQWTALSMSPLILAKGEREPLTFKREGDYVRLSGVHEQLALHVGDEAYLITHRMLETVESTLNARGLDVHHPEPWLPGPGPKPKPKSAMPPLEKTTAASLSWSSAQPDSAWREHSYAIPVSGDTVRFEGQDEGAVHYRYGIDFLPHQGQLQAAAAKRVSAFLKTLPQEVRPELLCAPTGVGLGLSPGPRPEPSKRSTLTVPMKPMKAMKPLTPSLLEGADQADVTHLSGETEDADSPALTSAAHAREQRLTAQRRHYLLDLFTKAGLSARSDLRPGACLDTWVMEWREPSAAKLTARLPEAAESRSAKHGPAQQDLGHRSAPLQVMLSDLTLLKTLQRWGEGAGWRVVSTDAPVVPIVKEASVAQRDFLDSAQSLIQLAIEAGFAVRATPLEGQVLLLTKGDRVD